MKVYDIKKGTIMKKWFNNNFVLLNILFTISALYTEYSTESEQPIPV